MTFSQHAATNRASIIYYSLLFAATLPLLYVFLAKWFAPHFELGFWFVACAGMSVVTQFVCTLFPEVGGWKTQVHRFITGISGVLLLPMMVMIAVSPAVANGIRIFAWVSFAIMIYLLGIALRNQAGYRFALLLQVGYYLLFFVTILSATYIS
jgi:hypothetical protein